jgi:hypothetical protein
MRRFGRSKGQLCFPKPLTRHAQFGRSISVLRDPLRRSRGIGEQLNEITQQLDLLRRRRGRAS